MKLYKVYRWLSLLHKEQCITEDRKCQVFVKHLAEEDCSCFLFKNTLACRGQRRLVIFEQEVPSVQTQQLRKTTQSKGEGL
ncbi:hypothetical protein CR205_00880 [Alteribacter lacisalsi]|uniref:Uncharacterized protein n=1 Tax=Alteribacter lacisalsi TaxID=2045244 RepID=A0A2W0HU78_9BACI|nr:hypothetical protein CR205_00880 [Alteribacter lacisalsi]